MQLKDDICLLISSRSPLSDDGGRVFATAFLRRILNFVNSDSKLQRTSVGSNSEVPYVLKQGLQTTKYTGYPGLMVRKMALVQVLSWLQWEKPNLIERMP